MEEKIILFNNESECCGCGGCIDICPKSAIIMKENEYGFNYPIIDYSICISCGLCKKICAFQNNIDKNKVKKSYVTVSKEDKILNISSSGGIFGTLANEILEKSGLVCGCSMEKNFYPKHVIIDKKGDLTKLQGSKYVQSETIGIFKKIKEQLIVGKEILFSGTPCQVAELKYFLGKEYSNLYTVEIICHGVPSIKFFQDYVKILENKLDGKIFNFLFRDKKLGWGLVGRIKYKNIKKHIKEKIIYEKLSSYYSFFKDGSIYRQSCYSCKYATCERVGDITIGDFWGIQKEHPNYLIENGGNINDRKGVSCLLVNTSQGQQLLKRYGKNILFKDSEFLKIAKHNEQLNKPTSKEFYNKKFFEIYKKDGYPGVEKWFNKKLGIKKYFYIIFYNFPLRLRKVIKHLLQTTVKWCH